MGQSMEREGLYRPQFEHDNCGIGAVVDRKGRKSREIVERALKIVENLEHRAGKDAEGETGDGVGILLQISHRFFSKACKAAGISLGGERDYGIGMFFFPQNELKRNQAKKMFEVIVEKEGMEFLGWRPVPVAEEVLGHKARECMPAIEQGFVKRPEGVNRGLDFDRRLYVVRRVFEQSNDGTYVASLSSRTVVYKGMFLVGQLRTFYRDLQSEDYDSAIAMVHSRFSTNTEPSWERAHPNRLIVHNGEINTIRGNADKMLAREETMESPCLHGELHKILPVVSAKGSDSAMLDNTLEFLMMNGMDLPLAVMVTIPEPWENHRAMAERKRELYQYYATMMEPWDGPASIVFSDGDVMGAVLDRNGLRPSRYYVLKDGTVILASEVGVLPVPEEEIVMKERLHPGKMLLVDTRAGKIFHDEEIKGHYAAARPYGEWLSGGLVRLEDLKIPNKKVPVHTAAQRARLQKAFGYTYEEYRTSIREMALKGAEGIRSMGADIPLAALSGERQPLFSYFKQLFAQVTNPPIDSIREEIVTSTAVYVGRDGNLLEDRPENCQVLKISQPILSSTDMLKLKELKEGRLKTAVVPILYYKSAPLERAMEQLFVEVDKAYRDGAAILILTDRGVDENHVAIPSLLAVSAVHQHLVQTKRRTAMSVILESGEPREVHHFATLLGYGASAVNPYLALETVDQLVEEGMLEKEREAAEADYRSAVLHGIVKIASKMGISTIQSYQGAKIFEAVGVSGEVIDRYFTGTVSRIGGITLEDIEREADELHSRAFDPLGLWTDLTFDSVGDHKMRSQGETHRYNPQTIHLLQQAVRTGDYGLFKQYTEAADRECYGNIRNLLELVPADHPVPLEEVEPVESIVKRFKTGAMSYGSISQEAHEALAVAMNRLGGKSNTGEGGESEERLDSAGTENDRCSAIKQVASGRFGVTSRYLVSAKEIQIKMAQGAKPGEGGHLPGGKVYPWVAKTRHSTPGVSLISPPPHHDIYSIEDLAQLIFDLKNANRDARISVKLVSEAGVGTVAAGVAKAGAQVVLISGSDGGTGAAPGSSIHNAGLPWELGVAETHQTLLKNGLRERVAIEADGKLMTGRDVAVAAMLGAEEFGFATAPLVALGCLMMRVCNLDTCPMGIATQNPQLRKRFAGKPEHVENFMRFIAMELREYLALLGVRTVEELVGRTDRLRKKAFPEGSRQGKVDVSGILVSGTEGREGKTEGTAPSHSGSGKEVSSERRPVFHPEKAYNFHLEQSLDCRVLLPAFRKSLERGEKAVVSVEVSNTDRAFGTILGSEITKYHKNGLPEDTCTVLCRGAGGQSFGAFIPKGLTLSLTGDSNDYFGKGLSGGILAVTPPEGAAYQPDKNIIVGNVALYGATGGAAYINGVAGERFCVRNSGAYAVVEGVGDHGCEYMTGGRVVVLGRTGENFAAGMSGGIAYVLDEKNELYRHLNREMVSMEPVENRYDRQELKSLIQAHVERTGSEKGREVLEHFREYLPKFKKIIPNDYRKVMLLCARLEEQGLSGEQAQIEAFYESTGNKREA